jgi:uncharacterized protein (DUF2141 family)
MIYLKNLKSLLWLAIFASMPGWVVAQQVAEAMPTTSMAGQIRVSLTQIRHLGSGQLVVALFKKIARVEMEMDQAFRVQKLAAKSANMTVVFENVPFGDYAVGVFHDLNNNGELDTNFIGYPKEDMAVSNNAKGGPFGGPPWREAKFQLNGPKLKIGVLKVYPFGPDKLHDG